MPKDALAEIEDALVHLANSSHGFRPDCCSACGNVDPALSLLPRLREVVEAAKDCRGKVGQGTYSEMFARLTRLDSALAALEGGKDGA